MKAKDNKTGKIWSGGLAKVFVRSGRATALTDEEEKELDASNKAKELANKKANKQAKPKGKGRPKKAK
jgi:hypothetical protein